MADLKPIEFPSSLTQHNLTEQELSQLTPAQAALAKDWNIMRRQNEWIIHRQVEMYNLMVEHDRFIEIFKKILWLASLVTASGGSVFVLIKFAG